MGSLVVPFKSSLKRQWMKRKYQRLNGSRKYVKIAKLGGNKEKRGWKIRVIPKLRSVKFTSPLKLWIKFKNAYMDMMLRLAGNVGALNGGSGSVLSSKRVPKARQVSLAYKNQEFENRVIYEIYKSLVVSMELNPR